MTFKEYKAWFEGFTEAFDGKVPTKAQWKRIQERLAEVVPETTIQWSGCRGHNDYYWRPWWPTWYTYTYTSNDGGVISNGSVNYTTIEVNSNPEQSFTTLAYDIGKQEALKFQSA